MIRITEDVVDGFLSGKLSCSGTGLECSVNSLKVPFKLRIGAISQAFACDMQRYKNEDFLSSQSMPAKKI